MPTVADTIPAADIMPAADDTRAARKAARKAEKKAVSKGKGKAASATVFDMHGDMFDGFLEKRP